MLKKLVQISPAFDKRDPDPKKNYGIGSCTLRVVLRGDKGAVQFVLYTGWYLPHVQKELEARNASMSICPADVGYHSPTPMYGDQSVCSEKCEYLDGKPCYYDGSGLAANDVFDILTEKGLDAVWDYLKNYYGDVFQTEEEYLSE